MNTARLLIDALERFGDYTLAYYEGKAYSSTGLMRRACALATVLTEHGVQPGDNVVVMMSNHPDIVGAFHAIWRIGAVIVPITPQLGPREVRYLLENSESRVAITSPVLAPVVKEASSGLAQFRHLLVTGPSEVEGAEEIEPQLATATPFESLVERGADDLALLIYTSGTTGTPKGVMLTHDNVASNAKAVQAVNPAIPPFTMSLAVLPLSHSYGVLMMNLGALYGSVVVVLPHFDNQQVFEAIQKYRVQRTALVPAMMTYMLSFPERDNYDTSTVEVVSSGSSALSNELKVEFERVFDCRISDGYGLSEGAAAVATYRVDETMPPLSVGRPLPGITVRVVDHGDNPLPAGADGEICIRGPNVMKGYWKNEPATRAALRGGWLHSGDVGHLDEDGFLYITGRLKDLIIKGGENISPAEIEEALRQHPAVAEAAVIGVPDELFSARTSAR